MIEYVSNAFISTITQMSSFLANYDFESRMSFDLEAQFNENTIRKRVNRFRNREIVFTMKSISKFVEKHMKKSQINQVKYANKHRIIC